MQIKSPLVFNGCGYLYKMYGTIIVLCLYSCLTWAGPVPPRYLKLTYSCRVINIPADAKELDWWIPVPSSDDRQTVELLPVAPALGQITTEQKYGNRMLYRHYNLNTVKPADTLTITMTYILQLNEKSVPQAKSLAALPKEMAGNGMDVYLSSTRLIPLEGPIASLNQQLQLQDEPIRAARQIYDYLIDNMVYNYKAPGAGVGDVVWACNSKTGDCSDYHSIFIGLCRSSGIPADHVFGLPLRSNQEKGLVKDWHCWARFFVEGPGWITIDASEADKHPELRDYLFGTLSDQYLTLSHGRDVVLEPAQQGPPLNIFADPYVEVDGKPFTEVKWEGSFETLKKD
ncbi:MAG TPA: transglutaminase domain-containing protein [Agriterribacter sp.]|nr:transglutaminase domain-containing protein [Agriterribacter sp.]